MALHGIDVSSHQGAVNWQAVAGAGIGFGFVKATGGSWYVNPTFAHGWQGAREAGLPRGAYHYAFESSGDPFPGQGPEVEADWFLSTVLPLGLGQGDMLVLDIEEAPHDGDAADWALRWLRRVESQVGYPPLCYTGAHFANGHGFGRLPALAHYPLWLAAYQSAQPAPPAPWPLVAFWQFTDTATVAGVSGPCDLNALTAEAGAIGLYGKPEDGGQVVAELPHYDPTTPAIAQNDNWSCAPTSCRWMLTAYGRQPSEQWVESSMLAEGVVSVNDGLLNATGSELARWINRHYGEFGYRGEHDPGVSFDDVAAEAATGKHPLQVGGRAWYHWSGVRGYADGLLRLANPGPGWKGINQTLSREQFEYLGPFSLVRLTHPAAEAGVPVAPPEPGDPFAPWRGHVGSGLLEMMAADGTAPAQRGSTWLPLGVSPSDVETCYGQNAVLYTWLLAVGAGSRYRPSI